jgi:hypothetical protein
MVKLGATQPAEANKQLADLICADFFISGLLLVLALGGLAL